MAWNVAGNATEARCGARRGVRRGARRGAPGQSEAHRLRGGVVRLAALLRDAAFATLEDMLVERRRCNTCSAA